jgi:hypothetical protein
MVSSSCIALQVQPSEVKITDTLYPKQAKIRHILQTYVHLPNHARDRLSTCLLIRILAQPLGPTINCPHLIRPGTKLSGSSRGLFCF